MKIAAIDLGSNSIHMVIVEAHPTGGFRVVDREAEMVRLGAGTLTAGRLNDLAMQKALAVLGAYRRLAAAQGVEQILAVSTSAIREARNGEDFLERLRKRVGILAKAISGEEEARLVYLAAQHSMHLQGRRTLVLDLGGGSLELALGRGPTLDTVASLKLGALRMTEKYSTADRPSPKAMRRMERFARRQMKPYCGRIRRAGVRNFVGTSGTILALGRLACELETGERPQDLHHRTVSTQALREVVRRLARLDARQRQAQPGLDRRRADIVVAGGIVAVAALELFGARELLLCDWALREGLLIDHIRNHRKDLAFAAEIPDPRRRSVLEMAGRYHHDAPHCRHVARLALSLFDALRRRHGLGPSERALLEYAALLHDAGHHIDHEGHHRHSYYLIKHGGLRGFDPREIEMIACIARYHRRGMPQKSHPGFAGLPREVRRKVEVLSGILRLADGLDRTHRQRVRSVAARAGPDGLKIRCRVSGEAELEMWGAAKRLDLLQKSLRVPVTVSIARAHPAAIRSASVSSRGKTRAAATSARRAPARGRPVRTIPGAGGF